MSLLRAFLLRFLCVTFILCSFKLPVIVAVPEMPNIVCPEYFQYVCLGERCVGKVTLRNIFLSTIDLEVQLVQTTLVTRGNYGSISLIQDESNIKTGQLISYRVDFPLANVLPRVTRIKVNENVICQSHDYLFLPPFSQTMFLKHHLVLDLPKLPDGQRAQFQTVAKSEPPKPQTNNNANQVVVQMEQQPAPIDIRSRNSFAPIGGTQQAAPTQSQVQPQSRSVSTSQQSERAQQQCRYQRIDLNELTDGVGVAQAGSLPWLAAVFRRQRKSVSYSCDGALISPRTVVTAAQCLQRHELLPEVTIVFLGWSDLADWSEAGTQPHAVQDIIMHPDYVQNGQPDADLALMQLKTPAVINQYVSPICLWRDTTAANGRQQTLNGQKAIVAGWPMVTPNQESNQPQITETILVDNEKCATISSESSQQQRTLCTEQKTAAQQQQSSDNQNKSCLENGRGSGLLMSHANQQWELRGITTAARSGAPSGDDNCSSQVTAPGYSSYCDLTKHRLWLLNLMQF